jgi:hypothetical protein
VTFDSVRPHYRFWSTGIMYQRSILDAAGFTHYLL